MSDRNFTPNWYEERPPKNSYRRLLKWGDLEEFKHPNKRLFTLMKETFNLTNDDFRERQKMGLEQVDYDIPSKLSSEQTEKFIEIAGAENVKTDNYTRLRVSYGKTMIDLMRLREGIVENIPDIVISPRSKKDILEIVQYCNQELIPIYVYGGGSSVTRGTEAVKGGVSLDMIYMNKVIELNETNQTITVEPGITGPDYEKILNNAVSELDAKRAYTCGHFPQSFEFTTVGGWVVTRGAGQNSTYYGKTEDMVVAQEYITPSGIIKTGEFPAHSCGPDIDQLMMGNEGAYGILVSVTMKIFRHMPKNQYHFSYMFKNWEDAKNAAREILQSEFGKPSAFRISDAEETDVAMKLYGIEGSPISSLLSRRGYKNNEKCLMLGYTDGEKDFAKLVKNKLHKVCKSYGAMNTTPLVAMKWKQGRFKDPYLREDLGDYGLMIDTLECSVSWSNMENVHTGVRNFIKSRPNTISMTHISHSYHQGANLYFIFIAKMDDIKEYKEFQKGVLDNIQKFGATMSHHHGIGKMNAPWLEGQIGKNQIEILRTLKKHFDPNNIMNPGGTLALDLDEKDKRIIKK